jgi:hypothetical protein
MKHRDNPLPLLLLLVVVVVVIILDFALFNVCSCKNCPSARCASAANVVCRDADVFGAENVHLNNVL